MPLWSCEASIRGLENWGLFCVGEQLHSPNTLILHVGNRPVLGRLVTLEILHARTSFVMRVCLADHPTFFPFTYTQIQLPHGDDDDNDDY